MTDKLTNALEEQKQQTEQFNQKIAGILGIPLGGQRRVEVAGRNAYVYVRLRSNQSEVIQAYNNTVATSYNLPVLVERQGNRYVVISVDTQRYDNNWNSQSPFLPRHGNAHSFDIESGGGGDIVWVYPRQIVPILVMPSGSSGAENVIVNPYTLMDRNGMWKYVGNTGTASLAPYKPTSPTGAVMALVYLDIDSGNPYLLINSGTVFSNTITGSSQVVQYIPTVLNQRTQIPLAAIRLITGTNQISWDNIYDARQFFRTNNSGPSENIYFLTSGSAGVSGFDLMTVGRPTNSYNYYSASISSTGTMIADFITESGVPNASFISDGIYHLHVHAEITAGTKNARLKYLFGKYSSGGLKTLLHTSELSNLVQSIEEEFDVEQFMDEHSLETTDRLWLEIYGFQDGLGTAPTVRLKVEGDTFSRFEIPAVSSQGGGISSIPIQDEGVSVGSATTFNFVGDGVQATISGSVARVSVSGGSINTGTLDARYLKIDASNDPLTSALTITPTGVSNGYTGLGIIQNVPVVTGTTSSPAIGVVRTADGAGPSSPVTYSGDSAYGFQLTDVHPYVRYIGGTLYHQDNLGVKRVDINPYAPSGIAHVLDTSRLLTGTNKILSVRNFGEEKFSVEQSGSVNIPVGQTYNVNGTPHTHSGGGDWVLIEDKYASTGTIASFDFQSIAGTYKHLRLELSLRSDRAANNTDGVLLRFNNDSGANYDHLMLVFSHSAGFSTDEGLAGTSITATTCPAETSAANDFGGSVIDIPDYANANINKNAVTVGSNRRSTTTGLIRMYNSYGHWGSTAAINRITVLPQNGSNWKQYSRATLYGQK